jgi:hypothetical protein
MQHPAACHPHGYTSHQPAASPFFEKHDNGKQKNEDNEKLVLAVILLCGICSGTCAGNRADTDIPVPASASPELHALIAAKPPQWGNSHPETTAEWKKLRDTLAKEIIRTLPALHHSLGVSMSGRTMAKVKVFTLTPDSIPAANRDRILLHFHDGG